MPRATPWRRVVVQGFERRATELTIVAAVLAAGSATGLGLVFGSRFRFDDERVYVTVADNLARTGRYSIDGVNPTAFQPPGFETLLGLLRWFHLNVVGLRIANALLLGLAVLLVSALARRIYSPGAGALAALLFSCYPVAVYTAASLYPQTLALVFLLGGLLAAERVAQVDGSRRVHWAALTGLLFGALALTVPTYCLVFPLLLVWWWRRAGRRAMVAGLVLVALVGASALPVMWTIRNERTLSTFVPLATNDATNLAIGNNPRARPTSGVEVYRDPLPGQYDTAAELRRRSLDRSAAMTWIREHPRQAAWLYLGKYLNNFNYRNKYFTRSAATTLSDLLGALVFVPLLTAFLLRLMLLGRRRYPLRRYEWSLLVLVLVNPLILAAFFTRIRFRVPLDAGLIMIVAGSAFWWFAKSAPPGVAAGDRSPAEDERRNVAAPAGSAAAASGALPHAGPGSRPPGPPHATPAP